MTEREDWTDQARRLLDASTEAIDAPTLSRLNRARQAALATRPRRTLWLPGGLAAACSVLLAAVVLWPHAPESTSHSDAVPGVVAGADDTDLLGADENLDLIQDLDFYAWLDHQDDQAG